MPKLLTFAEVGDNGSFKVFTSNDPDLTLNRDEATFQSAIVLSGNRTLYADVASQDNNIALTEAGGPDADDGYKDFADWGGAVPFHVKSIYQG